MNTEKIGTFMHVGLYDVYMYVYIYCSSYFYKINVCNQQM